ncbi:hypothetical protein ACIBJI_39900 [Nocardia sp. NPDC050408]|uniref:hypothetical protein n=1 Tax=Nocardia sp. NPDC050408 TaxID=3364319 RepID=UPI003797A482
MSYPNDTHAPLIGPYTIQLHEDDRIELDQAIGRWNAERRHLKIDRSKALNAAAKLLLRADNEDLAREHAAATGLNEQQTEQMVRVHRWLMDQYFEVLEEVIETRKVLDGRRKRGKDIRS